MTDISEADLRAVLAVLVSRAGGTVQISRTEVYEVMRPAGGKPASIDIESTGQGVQVTVHPHSTVVVATRDVRSNPLPDPPSPDDPRFADLRFADLRFAELRSDEARPRVAPDSRQRAARLVQAVAAAAAARGHGFRPPGPDSDDFAVVVGRRSYRLVLEEQHPRIEWLPDANDRRARQRIRSDAEPKPSGGLVLRIPDDSGRYAGRRGRWEDRGPSQLDDEVAAVLSEIEARAELDEQRLRPLSSAEPGVGGAGDPGAILVGQLESGELGRGR
jgi:hypothetical protein